MSIDYASLYAPGLPAPAVPYGGFPRYNFIGGHNDPARVPVAELTEAATAVLKREGATLAMYGMHSGPLGFRPLRQFLSGKLGRHAGIEATPDEILITSGSLQAIDLVNALLLTRGDTAIIERDNYGGVLTRLARLGVTPIGIPLDEGGMRLDALESALADCRARGVRPKYIYTIPTVQNPTGSIMELERRERLIAIAARHGVPIFEDECYSDLIWAGQRPPALYALAPKGAVIHVGSFSKSIAPALRVGYIVAPWAQLSRMVALKTDAGSGALEQMVLAEFCERHFDSHVPALTRALKAKLDVLTDALAEHLGTAAEYDDPKGGIFLWVKLPDVVDVPRLATAALARGVAINPGPEWSTDATWSRSRLRLCFASATPEEIREGVAVLAEVCRREFGVPETSGNVRRGA
jgi:2-aminoadipate transaminase